MSGEARVPVDLTGVPETLLWTLYYRARAASGDHPVIVDPLAAALVDRLDYPFGDRLGTGDRRAQWQGLRAATFDSRVRAHLRDHPGGRVVALGEGLETQFWRVDDGAVRWVGVDLPDADRLRRAVLPEHPRHVLAAGSVLDDDWAAAVPPGAPGSDEDLLLTAQGLLMYLRREEVHDLLGRCARLFPGAGMVFDGVPRWTSVATTRPAAAPRPSDDAGTPPAGLRPPPMPWWVDEREAEVLRGLPGIAAVERLHPPRGRGVLFGALLPLAERLPVLRSGVLSVWSLRFAPDPAVRPQGRSSGR